MSRLVLGTAIAALAGSPAAAQPSSYQVFPQVFPFQGAPYAGFPCPAFQPNPDGSWTVVQPVTIPAENGLIELSSGVTFPRRVAFGNLDLVALIERKCR